MITSHKEHKVHSGNEGETKRKQRGSSRAQRGISHNSSGYT